MEKISRLLKALSEPVRLRIFALLMEGERCVCDLMAVLDLPQSTISRHLAYMKNTGWLESERRGVWMYYRLKEDMDEFKRELKEVLARHLPLTNVGKNDLSRLYKYLEEKQAKRCK